MCLSPDGFFSGPAVCRKAVSSNSLRRYASWRSHRCRLAAIRWAALHLVGDVGHHCHLLCAHREHVVSVASRIRGAGTVAALCASVRAPDRPMPRSALTWWRISNFCWL